MAIWTILRHLPQSSAASPTISFGHICCMRCDAIHALWLHATGLHGPYTHTHCSLQCCAFPLVNERFYCCSPNNFFLLQLRYFVVMRLLPQIPLLHASRLALVCYWNEITSHLLSIAEIHVALPFLLRPPFWLYMQAHSTTTALVHRITIPFSPFGPACMPHQQRFHLFLRPHFCNNVAVARLPFVGCFILAGLLACLTVEMPIYLFAMFCNASDGFVCGKSLMVFCGFVRL